jgi:hypothetical protein
MVSYSDDKKVTINKLPYTNIQSHSGNCLKTLETNPDFIKELLVDLESLRILSLTINDKVMIWSYNTENPDQTILLSAAGGDSLKG